MSIFSPVFNDPYFKERESDKDRKWREDYNAEKLKYAVLWDCLIPYGPTFADYFGVVYKEVNPEFSFFNDRTNNVWLARPDAIANIIRYQKKNMALHWGKYSNGQKFLLCPVGLVLEVEDHINIDYKIVNGWLVPTPEWIIKSWRNQQFLGYIPKVERFSDVAYDTKSEQDLRYGTLNAAIQERLNTVKSKLEALGVEVNDVTVELFRFIDGYDHTWDFSDDARYSMRYSAKIKIVESYFVQYPKLKEVFEESKTRFKSSTPN